MTALPLSKVAFVTVSTLPPAETEPTLIAPLVI